MPLANRNPLRNPTLGSFLYGFTPGDINTPGARKDSLFLAFDLLGIIFPTATLSLNSYKYITPETTGIDENTEGYFSIYYNSENTEIKINKSNINSENNREEIIEFLNTDETTRIIFRDDQAQIIGYYFINSASENTEHIILNVGEIVYENSISPFQDELIYSIELGYVNMSQDNVVRSLNLGTSNQKASPTIVAANAINSAPAFTVSPKEIYFFKIILQGDFYTLTFNKLGKGNYGTNNAPVSASNLQIISKRSLSQQALLGETTTQVEELGDITGTTVYDTVNALSPTITIQPLYEGNTIFNATIDGEPVTYLFQGESGTVGSGQQPTVEDDFLLIPQEDKTKIKEDLIYVTLTDLGATSFDDNLPQLIKNYAIANNITKEDESLHSWIVVRPFEIMSNGVTVRLKTELGFGSGTTGLADGDTSGNTYTAVDNTMLYAMDSLTDDYTSVCTTLVTNLDTLFLDKNFNQNISSWDTSNVTSLNRTFENTPFNQDIGSWNVSNVKSMKLTFGYSSFNQNINNWDVRNVLSMQETFRNSSFNQPLNNWNVSSVKNMSITFRGSPFNQDIGSWDVSSVENMQIMFFNTPFNQDIGNWQVQNVTRMNNMFNDNFDFNQDLTGWCVTNIPTEPTDFAESTFAQANRPVWGAPC